MRQKIIAVFKDDFEFLSNFYQSQFVWKGYTWPTVEHAYQAAKTLGVEMRRLIRQSSTPSQAKRLGRQVILRSDWEDIKIDIMYELVKLKFFSNVDIAEKLLATGEDMLIEENSWHDNIWGDCCCHKCSNIEGENFLGLILMLVREDLKKMKER